MIEAERSNGAFISVLVVLALLGAAWVTPWYTYKFSTGPRTPPHDPSLANDTRTERERLEFFPYRTEGNETDDPNATAQDVRWFGHFVLAATVMLFMVAILEAPIPWRFSTRSITLSLSIMAFLSLTAALGWAMFRLWKLVASEGVTSAFTATSRPDGYVHTGLDWGWVFGGIASLMVPVIIAFKYQAGATDPTAIEDYKPKVQP